MKHALWIAVLAAASIATHAASAKVGMSVTVEGDGAFWNPVITKVRIVAVENGSLAQAAGIRAGDEITRIDGQPLIGRRANELRAYMGVPAGQSRTLSITHADGEHIEAKITKPAE